MIILPAIDILGGKCVRLTKGIYETAEQVAADPIETALEFEASGAEFIHMVDLDGAKEGRIFWRIVMPNVKSGWLTLMIFSVQTLWNTNNTMYIYSEELKTLPYAINQISSGGYARAGAAAAAVVIMMLVPIAVFIFSQSNVIETMAKSGIKE